MLIMVLQKAILLWSGQLMVESIGNILGQESRLADKHNISGWIRFAFLMAEVPVLPGPMMVEKLGSIRLIYRMHRRVGCLSLIANMDFFAECKFVGFYRLLLHLVLMTVVLWLQLTEGKPGTQSFANCKKIFVLYMQSIKRIFLLAVDSI